jgi:molybdopterin-guanine dinucleotide biosynthesis adapter protein
MKIYGVIGWKNAGKTSLMERLVAEFVGRGLRLSTVKHVHHDVDVDQRGKDSYRHRAAGAHEVILAGAHRFALMAEHRGAEPPLADLLVRLAPVDLVLVEGYKRDLHPKIEVWRAEAGHDLIQPHDPSIRAVATDASLTGLTVPCLDLNNSAEVADFIARELGLARV